MTLDARLIAFLNVKYILKIGAKMLNENSLGLGLRLPLRLLASITISLCRWKVLI